MMKLGLAGKPARNGSSEHVVPRLQDETTSICLSFAPDLPEMLCHRGSARQAQERLLQHRAETIRRHRWPGDHSLRNRPREAARFQPVRGQRRAAPVAPSPGRTSARIGRCPTPTTIITNDPQTGADCRTHDVAGMYACDFSGPRTQTELSGAMSFISDVGANCPIAAHLASVREVPKPLLRW